MDNYQYTHFMKYSRIKGEIRARGLDRQTAEGPRGKINHLTKRGTDHGKTQILSIKKQSHSHS